MLKKLEDVFRDEVGRCAFHEHQFNIDSTVQPKNVKSYPIPRAVEMKADQVVFGEWLQNNIIEESGSPWNNPLLVVRKKDSEVRVCIDLRNGNKAIKPMTHKVPNMEVMHTELLGAKWFTTIDFRQSFLQIPLHPNSRAVTAFLYKGKPFQ